MITQVSDELKHMETVGSGSWQKANITIWSCGDSIHLNKYICREWHVLSSIEHLVASIQSSKYFTKLDAHTHMYWVSSDSSQQQFATVPYTTRVILVLLSSFLYLVNTTIHVFPEMNKGTTEWYQRHYLYGRRHPHFWNVPVGTYM